MQGHAEHSPLGGRRQLATIAEMAMTTEIGNSGTPLGGRAALTRGPHGKPWSARSGPTRARVQRGVCQVHEGGPRSAWGQAFSRSHRTCSAANSALVRSGREPPVSPQQVADCRARGSQPPGWRWQVGGPRPSRPQAVRRGKPGSGERSTTSARVASSARVSPVSRAWSCPLAGNGRWGAPVSIGTTANVQVAE